MATTVTKWGNSLGVRIPKTIAEQVDLRDGTPVELEASGGVLTIRPVRQRKRRHTLAALLAKAKGPSPHRQFARDAAAGREIL
jgi:antitoxin MazE